MWAAPQAVAGWATCWARCSGAWEAAAQGAVLDQRLWTEFAAVTGAHGNSTALVGTPQQVADALLEYHKIGVDKFLIRGFDPVPDTQVFGRDVIPLVRAAVARLN